MIRAILTIINVNASQRLNGIIYYLKRVPLLKKLIKGTNYSFLGFKKFLSVVSILYNIISGPIIFALFFGVAVLLPVMSYLPVNNKLNSIMFFIFIFFYAYQILGSELMEPNQETFIIVKQMKMDPKVYAISQTIWKKTRNLFSRGLVFALAFKLFLNKDPFSGVLIVVSATMFTIIMEAIHLYIFKKTGFIVNKLEKTRTFLILGGIAATYAIVSFTNIPDMMNLFPILSNIYVTIGFIVLGVLGFTYLLNYDRYWEILNEDNTLETFKEIEDLQKDINFQEVKLRDKDFDEEALIDNDASDREGYDYLNHIFFKRHKRVIIRPIIRKSLIIAGIFLIIFAIDRYFVDDFQVDLGNAAVDIYTMLVFAVYIICNSTSIIKSLFYNCDRSLLRYGFYKESDALLEMFFLRLRKILLTNLIPIFVLCIGLAQLIFFNVPERASKILPIVVATIVLGILFSVHYLFIYYILQPFTTDLKTKSPLYTIINIFVYVVSYLSILAETSITAAFPYIIIFAILYIGMATILVYKKAPDTFKVK